MVASVGDEEPSVLGEYLAWIPEGRRRRRVSLEGELYRVTVDRSLCVELIDEGGDDGLDSVVYPFACPDADSLAGGIHQRHGWPSIRSPRTPDLEVLVVHHRMGDLVPLDDVPKVLSLTLVGELGRVHPNDHQLLGKLGLEPFQVRNDMNAVDTAIRPEVEENDLALQRVHRDRLVGVDPVEAVRKLWGFDLTCEGLSGVFGRRRRIAGGERRRRLLLGGARCARGREQTNGGDDDELLHEWVSGG